MSKNKYPIEPESKSARRRAEQTQIVIANMTRAYFSAPLEPEVPQIPQVVAESPNFSVNIGVEAPDG